MSSGPQRVSPSALGTFAVCPRQYEYERVWKVSAPERTERYLNRGLAYHGVLEDLCESVAEHPGLSDEEIRTEAQSLLDTRWDRHVDPTEYYSDAQRQYDRAIVDRAIASYLDGDGLAHVRNSIETEVWLECDRNGAHLLGRADNVVRTDSGLQVIDYKGSLKGIVTSKSAGDVVDHLEREEYAPDRLKSVFQAATYIEGAKQLDAYEPGMDVEFTFYGLLANKDRHESLDGIEVTVSGYGRDVAAIYEEYREPIWDLIKDYYDRIVAADLQIDRWSEVRENACGDCDYSEMCANYLGAEVGVHE